MSAAGQWQWLQQRSHDVAATQLHAGRPVVLRQQPHDPATVHHVAIAIGHGRMVEAPAPGIPVRLVPVRWTDFYAAARPVN